MGKSGFTLESILRTLLEGSPAMEYVLIEGSNDADIVRLNECCGLIGQRLKKMSQSILNNLDGIMTIVPPRGSSANVQFFSDGSFFE